MGSLEDKKLLLLGILAEHSTHGYALNKLLKSDANAIRIGKANAYQILGKLEQEKYVRSQEERIGNRPPRQVYTITDQGKTYFYQLLKKRLAQYQVPEYPDGVSLNFISLLPPQQAVPLLEQRATHLADRCIGLSAYSDDIRATHPGLELMIQQTQLESDFLNQLIQALKMKIKECTT